MQKKLSLRMAAPLILPAALFILLAGALNGSNAVQASAKENVTAVQQDSGNNTGGTAGKSGAAVGREGEAAPATGPACTCGSRCSQYVADPACPACSADYRKCAYREPCVKITILAPSGWHPSGSSAKATIRVEDILNTGNLAIKSVKAKAGQNGSYQDVTEDMCLEISENCSVYALVTDANDKSYERSRYIKCFDTSKPTLNAAVSDGLLTVQVHDTDSGAKAVYVNGYEFTDLTNGTLNIRLQQFDAGYEYFTISAMDNAGNMSEVYKTKNPYYKDPADGSDGNPAGQLPVNAEATRPGSATGTVTEHTETDGDGNTVSQTPEEQKKEESAKADAAEAAENGDKEKAQSEQGKEFYTIQTASDKVFYLIIDRDGEEEMVYFLTEVTENDLLNATSGNSETLPKNSAALESAIPAGESALPNNNGEMPEDTEQTEKDTEEAENTEAESTEEPESAEDVESTEEAEPEEETAEPNPMASYILMGALAAAFIGGAYYFKVVRKKKEDFIEDEDEDEEDTEEYEDEDEEPEDASEDEFFEDEEDG